MRQRDTEDDEISHLIIVFEGYKTVFEHQLMHAIVFRITILKKQISETT